MTTAVAVPAPPWLDEAAQRIAKELTHTDNGDGTRKWTQRVALDCLMTVWWEHQRATNPASK